MDGAQEISTILEQHQQPLLTEGFMEIIEDVENGKFFQKSDNVDGISFQYSPQGGYVTTILDVTPSMFCGPGYYIDTARGRVGFKGRTEDGRYCSVEFGTRQPVFEDHHGLAEKWTPQTGPANT